MLTKFPPLISVLETSLDIFDRIAAESPEGDDKTEVRVRMFWRHFRFMQGKNKKNLRKLYWA